MNNLFRKMAKDNRVYSSLTNINIDELLLQNTANSPDVTPLYLEGQTLKSIQEAIYVSLCENIPFHTDTNYHIETLSSKLTGYRYVDELYQLQLGKHVRWMRIPDSSLTLGTPECNNPKLPVLTNGGIVVDIKIMDMGVHILCKNGGRYIQYKFDECLTYQKLTTDELMIVTAYKFATTS